MFNRFLALAPALSLALLLAACSGIPLRSMPKLMALQGRLLEADPAEFLFAVQVDARLVPPPGAVPALALAIRPAKPGAFAAVDEKLPMRMTVATANGLGLATPPANRRWLIYALTPESQAELARVQAWFRRLRAERGGGGEGGARGGTMSVGIAQEGIAVAAPALADSRWESWLRVARADGFFALWSGTLAELRKLAKSG